MDIWLLVNAPELPPRDDTAELTDADVDETTTEKLVNWVDTWLLVNVPELPPRDDTMALDVEVTRLSDADAVLEDARLTWLSD